MAQLLIVRDAASFSKAWNAFKEMYRFECGQRGESKGIKRNVLLGVWTEPTLLVPHFLKPAGLFSLSGIWSLCEWDPDGEKRHGPEFQRKRLITALFNNQPPGKSFMPAFETSETRSSVRDEVERLRRTFPDFISGYITYENTTCQYRIEENHS